jgi:hypothetical protein
MIAPLPRALKDTDHKAAAGGSPAAAGTRRDSDWAPARDSESEARPPDSDSELPGPSLEVPARLAWPPEHSPHTAPARLKFTFGHGSRAPGAPY